MHDRFQGKVNTSKLGISKLRSHFLAKQTQSQRSKAYVQTGHVQRLVVTNGWTKKKKKLINQNEKFKEKQYT